MYFNTELKVEKFIYLIESISRSLISIHTPSGKAKIEAHLPWECTGKKIRMLPLERGILIYSFTEDHFLVYDRLEQQIRTIELQGIEADEAGFYCSNVLIDQDEFVILPFKGETIRRYGITGKLISKDNIWCSFIDRECNFN